MTESRKVELEKKLAYTTARTDIECFCVHQRGHWYELMEKPETVPGSSDQLMYDSVQEAFEYLTLIGKIQTHPRISNWVKILD